MAGQLGNVRNTIQNLVIVKILLDENTILVKGSIPGHDGSDVIIKPTRKKYTVKEILTNKETESPAAEVKSKEPKEPKEPKESAEEKKPIEKIKAEEKSKE